MKRNNNRAILAIVLVGFVMLIIWIARNTYWDQISIPSSFKNEAATNPFYVAQRLIEKLGGTTSWDRVQRDLPRDAVLVVSSWHWDISPGRRSRMEQWVESGGRLVLDKTLVGGEQEFERWSGLSRKEHSKKTDDKKKKQEDDEEQDVPALAKMFLKECHSLQEVTRNGRHVEGDTRSFELCVPEDGTRVASVKPVLWALADKNGNEVVRVNVGKGSVTLINSVPFRFDVALKGDNAALLIAAAQLRRGDDVHFLSEEDHPSLLELMWLMGWPVVLLVLALILLALWRNSVRFGPLVAVPDLARRSLAEQIRGTGLFVIRFGGGKALHAAAIRALNEAARRREVSYLRMSAAERIEALARLTGIEAGTLTAAIAYQGPRRPNELRQAIVLIESARRRVLVRNKV